MVDVLGRTVRVLADETAGPGLYRFEWDGRVDSGRPAASGVYFYRLILQDHVVTGRLIKI